jgi:hypothetical protein
MIIFTQGRKKSYFIESILEVEKDAKKMESRGFHG